LIPALLLQYLIQNCSKLQHRKEDWPGNIRELENCIEKAVLLSSDGVIHGHHLPPTLQTSDASGTIGIGSLTERINLFERDLIIDALKRCNGNPAATARDLKTTARIIRYKIRELGIDYKRYRGSKNPQD
jgi:Nif-specific regulatory protein